MTEPQSSDQEWTNRGETSEIWQRYRCPVCGHMDAVSASTPTIASIRCMRYGARRRPVVTRS